MYNRTFKKKSILIIRRNNTSIECADERAARRWIYANANKGEMLPITEIEPKEGIIYNEWLYKYAESGVIFKRKTYDLWMKLKKQAEMSMVTLDFGL